MTRNMTQEFSNYLQRVLRLIPDHLCRIQAWKHFKLWKCGIVLVSSPFPASSHIPGEVHLDVVAVQHVFLPIYFQGHGTVLHPELVLPLQSRQSLS